LIEVARASPDKASAMLQAAALVVDNARNTRDPAPKMLALPPPAKRKASAGAKRSASSPAAAIEPVTANGITVAGREVRFNGKAITVSPREVAVAAELAKVSPGLLGADVLARRIWNRTDDLGKTLAGQAARALGQAVEAIGLLDRPHWLVEFALFALAGIVWAWPAAWLMRRVIVPAGAGQGDTKR
jgi:hypothetical protein